MIVVNRGILFFTKAEANWLHLIRHGLILSLLPHNWKKVKIDLLPLIDGESVIIRYKPINDLGSNLFLDNIFVYSSENPETVNSPNSISINIFPNPAEASLQVKLERFIIAKLLTLMEHQDQILTT